MQVNVIYTAHYDADGSKLTALAAELSLQGIEDYKLWDGVRDYPVSKAINRSHKRIVQDAKDRSLRECCIMEDDVKFTNIGQWDRFIKKKPASFDLYLAGIYQRVYDGEQLTSFTGLHCYIISQRFYDKFLLTDDALNPDVAVSGLGKFIVCRPFAAIQRPGWSANNGCVTDYSGLLQKGDLYE